MKDDNLYDFSAELISETEKAWTLLVEKEMTVSIPKSVGEFDGQTLTLSEKWVIKKGMEGIL